MKPKNERLNEELSAEKSKRKSVGNLVAEMISKFGESWTRENFPEYFTESGPGKPRKETVTDSDGYFYCLPENLRTWLSLLNPAGLRVGKMLLLDRGGKWFFVCRSWRKVENLWYLAGELDESLQTGFQLFAETPVEITLEQWESDHCKDSADNNE